MVERSVKRNRGASGRMEATRLQGRVTKDLGVLDPGPGSTCPKSSPTPTPKARLQRQKGSSRLGHAGEGAAVSSTCHSHSYCYFSCKPKYRILHTKSQDDLCSRKNRISDGLVLLQEDELRKIRKWTKSKSNSPT